MAPWARAWLSAVALPAPLSGPPGSVRVHSSAGEVAGSGRDMLALAVVMALLPVAAMVVVAVEVVVNGVCWIGGGNGGGGGGASEVSWCCGRGFEKCGGGGVIGHFVCAAAKATSGVGSVLLRFKAPNCR